MDRPAPFADLSLARRLERAEGAGCARFVEARAAVEPGSGAEWIEAGGAYAMFDTPNSPITQTFGLGVFEPATPEILDRIETFFRDRGAPVMHEVSPLAGAETVALLAARGYRPIELSSVLYRPIGPDDDFPSAGPGITAGLTGGGEWAAWSDAGAAGWSDQGDVGSQVLDFLGIWARRADALCFVASIGGTIAGTGSLGLHDGVALLAGASTVPAYRRRGVQLALLGARLRYAVAQGADLAMMAALPGSGSQRNAERHGFRIAYTRTKWQLG